MYHTKKYFHFKIMNLRFWFDFILIYDIKILKSENKYLSTIKQSQRRSKRTYKVFHPLIFEAAS
jgi:hypothetical protein